MAILLSVKRRYAVQTILLGTGHRKQLLPYGNRLYANFVLLIIQIALNREELWNTLFFIMMEQKTKNEDRLRTFEDQIKVASDHVQEVDKRFKGIKQSYEKVVNNRKKIESDKNKIQEELDQGEEIRQDLTEKHSQLQAESARLAAELLVLEQAEQKLAGYAEGAKLLLTQSREEG